MAPGMGQEPQAIKVPVPMCPVPCLPQPENSAGKADAASLDRERILGIFYQGIPVLLRMRQAETKSWSLVRGSTLIGVSDNR